MNVRYFSIASKITRRSLLRHWALLVALVFTLAAVASAQESSTLFSNENIYAVTNRPTRATTFTLNRPAKITRIRTYHWNNGWGTVAPGTIALKSSAGELFGPWETDGLPGQGGVTNAYWVVNPDIVLMPGAYTIVDSETVTWSQNAGSARAGMAAVLGYFVRAAPPVEPRPEPR